MIRKFARPALAVLAYILLIGSMVYSANAQIPPKVENTWIQDHANVFTPEQETALDAKVKSIGKNINFAIVTVSTLEGKDVAEYTLELGRAYGIGAANGEHRGLIYLIAPNERKVRIEVSRHLEGYITDGQTGTINRSVKPLLKAGDWYGAANSVADQLIAASAGVPADESQDVVSDQKSAPQPDDGTGLVMLAIFFALLLTGGIVYIFIRIRRKIEEREEAKRIEVRRKQREEQEAAWEREREAERVAHEAWLKTPEGIADTERKRKQAAEAEARRREAARLAAIEAEKERARYAKWAASPEGKAELARKAKAEREAAERQRKAEKARREQEEEEAAQRRRRSSYSSSSYGSSYGSSSSSSSDSGSFGGFGGSSDFGGGGSSDSF